MTEISLAGKQALSKIKAEISSMIIAKSTAPAVKAATLDPEFVKQMLLTVAKNWSGADSSKNQLKALLPEAEQKAFEATFEAAAKELLAAGVEAGYSKDGIQGGCQRRRLLHFVFGPGFRRSVEGVPARQGL